MPAYLSEEERGKKSDFVPTIWVYNKFKEKKQKPSRVAWKIVLLISIPVFIAFFSIIATFVAIAYRLEIIMRISMWISFIATNIGLVVIFILSPRDGKRPFYCKDINGKLYSLTATQYDAIYNDPMARINSPFRIGVLKQPVDVAMWINRITHEGSLAYRLSEPDGMNGVGFRIDEVLHIKEVDDAFHLVYKTRVGKSSQTHFEKVSYNYENIDSLRAELMALYPEENQMSPGSIWGQLPWFSASFTLIFIGLIVAVLLCDGSPVWIILLFFPTFFSVTWLIITLYRLYIRRT